MSKEQLLEEYCKVIFGDQKVVNLSQPGKCAEIAKQQAIEFQDWLDHKNTEWRDANGKEYNTEKLYTLFLNQSK